MRKARARPYPGRFQLLFAALLNKSARIRRARALFGYSVVSGSSKRDKLTDHLKAFFENPIAICDGCTCPKLKPSRCVEAYLFGNRLTI